MCQWAADDMLLDFWLRYAAHHGLLAVGAPSGAAVVQATLKQEVVALCELTRPSLEELPSLEEYSASTLVASEKSGQEIEASAPPGGGGTPQKAGDEDARAT